MTFIFLIYPTITSYAFGMFNCSEVEEVSYLSVDFDIECWSKEHIGLQLKYTLPAVLVWVLGFPCLVFYLLHKNRASLDEKQVLAKYGLYYIGFTDKAFYWQVVVINMRRALYIAIAVAVQGQTKNFFVFLIFLVMYLYMSATRWLQPYHSYDLNQTDIYSSLTTLTTLLSALFFVQDGYTFPQGFLTGLFILLIIINSVYLFYWFTKIFPIGLKMALKFFSRCCPKKVESFEKKMTRAFTKTD
eukprot:CAMPEP_0170548842 /NCGR_PEP_ID=MMETSP0211-20121228/7020_1 /TAXON_ID=311385 /ORGANISM="Pseudokeronopsis sp., Strain OXSARD2" /LENGTH=243 /DNA_ID=CAMNT_0010854503 /DNA_START=1879 /DNA_END=2610 /DNA_ORIENTATION=-